jgi:hypothetical protein
MCFLSEPFHSMERVMFGSLMQAFRSEACLGKLCGLLREIHQLEKVQHAQRRLAVEHAHLALVTAQACCLA